MFKNYDGVCVCTPYKHTNPGFEHARVVYDRKMSPCRIRVQAQLDIDAGVQHRRILRVP